MRRVSKCCSFAGLFAIIASSVTAGPVDYRAGDIFVVGTEGFNPVGQISRFDPSTGQRDIVARAGLLDNPTDVTFARDGDLLVSDLSGKVIRVDRKTGMQSL